MNQDLCKLSDVPAQQSIVLPVCDRDFRACQVSAHPSNGVVFDLATLARMREPATSRSQMVASSTQEAEGGSRNMRGAAK